MKSFKHSTMLITALTITISYTPFAHTKDSDQMDPNPTASDLYLHNATQAKVLEDVKTDIKDIGEIDPNAQKELAPVLKQVIRDLKTAETHAKKGQKLLAGAHKKTMDGLSDNKEKKHHSKHSSKHSGKGSGKFEMGAHNHKKSKGKDSAKFNLSADDDDGKKGSKKNSGTKQSPDSNNSDTF